MSGILPREKIVSRSRNSDAEAMCVDDLNDHLVHAEQDYAISVEEYVTITIEANELEKERPADDDLFDLINETPATPMRPQPKCTSQTEKDQSLPPASPIGWPENSSVEGEVIDGSPLVRSSGFFVGGGSAGASGVNVVLGCAGRPRTRLRRASSCSGVAPFCFAIFSRFSPSASSRASFSSSSRRASAASR